MTGPASIIPFPPLPKGVRYLALALAAALTVSSAAMGVALVVLPKTPIWIPFGFELVCAAAGVIGVLSALGRFDWGQGMAWACVAGTLFVSAVLGHLGTPQGVAFQADAAPTSLREWFLLRLALSAVFGLVGAYAVLRRDGACRAYLVKAAITGVPLLLILGVGFGARSRVAAITESWPSIATGGLLAVLALLCLVLVSASAHCLIRAFECGRK